MEDAKARFMKMWKNADRKKPRITFVQNEFNSLANVFTGCSTTNLVVQSIGDIDIELSTSNNSRLSLRSVSAPVDTLIIASIVVHPTQQGIGTNILHWLNAYAKEKGFKRISIENADTEDSVQFAIKRGFSKCYKFIYEPEFQLSEGGEKWDDPEGDYELIL